MPVPFGKKFGRAEDENRARVRIAVRIRRVDRLPGPLPNSMSTYWSVVACSCSALASETVRIGRFISSENSRPAAELVMPKR